MKKMFYSLTTVAILSVSSLFLTTTVDANQINDLENKRLKVKEERSDIKSKLSKAEEEIADVLVEINELNEEIARVEETLEHNQTMMKEVHTDIEKSEEEMEQLEQEIKEVEEKIEARYDVMKKRISSYQTNGGTMGYLEVLFGSKSFGEFISRASAVTTITNSDVELVEEQEADKLKVESMQKDVEEKLTEQIELKLDLEEVELVILDQQDANDKAKKKLTSKEKELKTLKSELKNEDSDLSAIEAEVNREINRARNPVVSNSNNNSSNNSSNNSDENLQVLGKQEKATPKSTPKTSGSGGINTAMNVGKQFIGRSTYSWGAMNPAAGQFDCSGFVSWAFGQAGYSIARSTSQLAVTGTKISPSNMQPGDLVFFDTVKRNGHVGIYLGGNKFIGSQSSSGVSIADMNTSYWKNTFNGHVRRVH